MLDTQNKKIAKVAMQTFKLLIMTTQGYRQRRTLKMLTNKFSIRYYEIKRMGHYSRHKDLVFVSIIIIIKQ